MKCDTFTFMRQYLTSCNNHTHKKKGGREYNSLQKVLHPLKKNDSGNVLGMGIWQTGYVDRIVAKWLRTENPKKNLEKPE